MSGVGAIALTAGPSAARHEDRRPPIGAPTTTTTRPAGPPLGPGDVGPAIVTLQQRLQALGYEVRQSSGTFDDATLHATRAFQKVNGLPVTGVADAATAAAFEAPVAPVAQRPAAPGASRSTSPARSPSSSRTAP